MIAFFFGWDCCVSWSKFYRPHVKKKKRRWYFFSGEADFRRNFIYWAVRIVMSK